MEKTYLEVHVETGWVINTIIWDGVSPYSPDGIALYPCADHPNVRPGWKLANNKWVAPAEQPELLEGQE